MTEYQDTVFLTDIPLPLTADNRLLQYAVQLIAAQIAENIKLPDGITGLKITWKAEIIKQ